MKVKKGLVLSQKQEKKKKDLRKKFHWKAGEKACAIPTSFKKKSTGRALFSQTCRQKPKDRLRDTEAR